MRTSTLRRYTCSNSSSSVFRGRVRDHVLAAASRSGSVIAGAVVSALMSLVAICASGCDIACPRHAVRRLSSAGDPGAVISVVEPESRRSTRRATAPRPSHRSATARRLQVSWVTAERSGSDGNSSAPGSRSRMHAGAATRCIARKPTQESLSRYRTFCHVSTRTRSR